MVKSKVKLALGAVGVIAPAVGIPAGLVVKNKLTDDTTNTDLVLLKDLLNGVGNKLTSKNTIEASTMPIGSTSTDDLGISLKPPSGITFAYEITDNSGDGFLNILITATKGSTMATKEIQVTGFESKAQAQLNDDQTSVDSAVKWLIDQTTTKNTIEASAISQGIATATNLGIQLPPPSGVAFIYEVTDNSGDGFLNVRVTATSGSVTATKDIQVIGFETKAQAQLQAKLKAEQASVDSAINSLTDQITTKNTIEASGINQGSITEPDLGISLTPPTGVTYAYEITDNTGDGFLNVRVTVTSGSITGTKDIRVTGFETKAQADQASVTSAINSLTDQTTTKNTIEASTISQGTSTLTNLGITLVPPSGVTYTYEVINNTGDGFLNVRVTAISGLATATKDIQVTGFETQYQVRIQAQLKADQASVTSAINSLTDQTTSKNTVGASTIHQGSTILTNLGISLTPPTGVTYSYEVTNNTNDGFVNVRITVTSGSITATKDIKVTGFESKAQIQLELDQASVTSAINSLTDQTTTKNTVAASEISQGTSTLTNLGITLVPPTGVTYSYEVTNNTNDGFVNVRITVTSGSITATKDIKVTGFESKAQIQLELDQALVTSAINSLTDQTTTKNTVAASEISQGTSTLTNLGITLVPPSGVTYAYEVTDNNGDGFVNVRVTVTSGLATATKDIKIKGFLAALFKADRDATKAANALTDTTTSLNNTLASTFNNGPTTQKALGISIAEQPGITYTYKVVSANDKGVYVEVTLTSGSITKVKTIKVTGFKVKTQAQFNADQASVTSAINSLTDQTTTKNTIEASTIHQGATTSTNLGITLVPPTGITFAYEVIYNTGDGFLNVLVTATKGSAKAATDIRVTGFRPKSQAKLQAQLKADQDSIDSLTKSLTDQTTSKNTIEASTIRQGSTTLTNLGISLTPPTGITFTYEVTDNTGDGFLNVRVTATKGSASATGDIKVIGFESKAQVQLKVDQALVVSADKILSDTTTSLNNILASTFNNGPTTQKALGITIAEQPGITYTYKVVGTSDGEVSISVTLTKGSITKVKTIKVIGFETKAQVQLQAQLKAEQALVESALKSITDQVTSRITISPLLMSISATTSTNLGISLTPPTGITFTYEVTDNTGDGFLNVRVTATKGSASATKDIKVTGFKTKTQMQLKVDQALVVSADKILSDTTTSLNNILASTFNNGPTTQKALGITIAEQPGITYTYKVVGTSDGEVSIGVTLTKGLAIVTVNIKVNGFKTKAQIQLELDQASVTSAINSLTDQTTTKNTVGASVIYQGATSLANLGISLTPPTGITFTYEVTDNTGDGFLNVRVTATKGSATATKDIKVTGFEAKAQAQLNTDQTEINLAIKSITDQATTKRRILSSTIFRGATTSTILGITLTPPTGVKYSYEVTDNTRDGFLNVRVTITSGLVTATKDIKVTGFLINDDKDLVDRATSVLASEMATSTHNVNAQTISVGKTTLAVLGISLTPPKGVAFSYNIVNIGNGFINVKVAATRGFAISTKIIKVTGFAHHYSAQEAVDRLPGSQNWNQYSCSYSQVASVLPAPLGVHFRYDISNYGTRECSGVYIYATDEQGVTKRSRWVDLY